MAKAFALTNPSPSSTAEADLAACTEAVKALLRAPSCNVLVADIAGEVVATIVTAYIPSLVHGGRPTMLLDLLVVAQEYRRQGIGSALVGEAVRLARAAGAYKILAVTSDDNEPARQLYRKLQFRTSGIGLACYLSLA